MTHNMPEKESDDLKRARCASLSDFTEIHQHLDNTRKAATPKTARQRNTPELMAQVRKLEIERTLQEMEK